VPRRTLRSIAAVASAAVVAGCGVGGEGTSVRDAAVSRPASVPAVAPAPPVEPARPSLMRPVAVNAAGLARRLTEGETAARNPESGPSEARAGGELAQVAYRQLGRRPAWDSAVLAAVPRGLRWAVRHNLAARREFIAMAAGTPPKRTLPAWRIVEPLPEATLRTYYARAQRRFGVPWEVLAAVNLVETGMGRIIGLSPAGAKGPMQFMPSTWRRYGMGGDVWDARDAILGAANYLAANGAADGTTKGMRTALRRYNNSARYVRAVLHYAALMTADPIAYRGFRAWRIYYRTHLGDVLLPTGYAARRPVPVEKAVRPGF
jgi:membrane-bound lytic murein transglycosylase B